jgi:hypothetical protein
MKLADHTEHIRKLIDTAFRNRLGRMGVSETALLPLDSIPAEYRTDRKRIETIREVFIKETGTVSDAFEKLVEELTFTLFNRIAALKVMEAHTLHPEIITRRTQHGDRSFAHLAWLEQNNEARNKDAEGLVDFFEEQLTSLENDIPLFSPKHPYHLVPTPVELNTIINAFNQIETDTQVDAEIWKSDDVLGWLYESYNNQKKADHKLSKAKTEYNKVSIQSQVYTPKWVVKFLVDNSLGKFYLEMYPHSAITEKYKIANAPTVATRVIKPLIEIRLIDPSTGSGNFLLYAFDVFYDLYLDNINEQGNPDNYDEANIAKLIIENNLHGVDLDDRAVQLAQLGLYIKAKRKKRSIKIDHFQVVSSDFFLPEYIEVKHLFENGAPLDKQLEKIVTDLWKDLQQAYKYGSLIRLEEKFNLKLHGLVAEFSGTQVKLFTEETLASYEQFRENFFGNLQKAVAQNTAKQGQNFLNTKTQDAITFLSLLTQKYDIAVANPPYTDSGDFGPELRAFIEKNYKKPNKFNSNLYAAFIKRCCELTTDDGYVGMIHPHTFMFIKSFEDVRKYLIKNTHIDLMVDYGLDRVNLFGPGILLDATWYVISKKKKDTQGFYFNITANQQEKAKQNSLEEAYIDTCNSIANERVYKLPQEKLKIIDGFPFIYWISDEFREKFKTSPITKTGYPVLGLKTANNNKFLRYHWELQENNDDWISYAKGGEFNRWYGNVWLKVNWTDDGELIKNYPNSQMIEKGWSFKNGVTLSTRSNKGISARVLDESWLFDMAASSIITIDQEYDKVLLAYSNSSLFNYIAKSLNPTVNTQPEDIRRIPFVKVDDTEKEILSNLANDNISIKKNLCSFNIIETNFKDNPLLAFKETSIKDRIYEYLNLENAKIAQVLINEAIINKLIFEVYKLSDADRKQVEDKMGKSIGILPVEINALNDYKSYLINKNFASKEILKHFNKLEITNFEEQYIRSLQEEFTTLYQSNNDLEEFCIRHQVNPINVWYWFKESKVLPQSRAIEIVLEFLADAFRTLLMEDEDGIIPLVGLPGEPRLLDRLEQHCLQNGFTSAQFMQLDNLLGRPISEYIEHHFFKNLSDHLNLFMYLPKTPFIWHLSSGKYQGFEAYIIIYKWNRDSLFKLKTQYLAHRVENLEYRLIQLQDVSTAQAQNEKETIRYQLEEIKSFTAKIDELIAENYNPKLDDGVGKNIAPLQKKGLLRADVLKAPQLTKYLKADW